MHISSEEEGSNESQDDPVSDADNDNEYHRENEDVCITVARENIKHARDKMCKKHDKKSKIISFAIGDIAVVKLPRGTRTATDQRKLFCKVIGCQYTTSSIQDSNRVWYYRSVLSNVSTSASSPHLWQMV